MLKSPSNTSLNKGRSARLVARRNRKMVIRYYYWREIKRLRSDDVFSILAHEEFFLEEITIRRLIRKNLDYLTYLRKERPSEKKLNALSLDDVPTSQLGFEF